MGTLVYFHAHPDDEAILTGGSMARAHAEGHRVVLVVATDGAHGEVPDDLAPGETLMQRRQGETERSAAVLGIDQVHWLGYTDSGMTGWDQNLDPTCFLQADRDAAAQQLTDLLIAEDADVLVIYDWHGGYGHPDHIKVHQVGVRAAELLHSREGDGAARELAVFEATMNRDEFARMIAMAKEMGEKMGADLGEDFDPDGPADDGNPIGMPEAELTHRVDVAEYVHLKRAAIACHRSQISDSAFFLQMDEGQFAMAFGTEWFIRHGADHPVRDGWLIEENMA
jgi:LmbE family N-acetylglucosaminyl deacetylase